ncbi:hypothetical protein CNMCM8927_005227 [Aspergillus lentulus]|uniref:dolichyl-phosphate beta-glucosyltransferase n=1 Tax=Aspergillus lentulus TaxID=293939 RepID=A0AAN5YQV9_ASPLE|nr:hypothetical protein CNMCM8927_005227 [Aspergillus lentulus]
MAEESWIGTCVHCTKLLASVPLPVLLVAISATLLGSFVLVCSPLDFLSSYPNVSFAPEPRKPLPEEKRYRTLSEDGAITQPEQLPCWQDALDRQKRPGRIFDHSHMEKAELFLSLVVPAYNEEDRLAGMLEDAVNYLERMYGTLAASSASEEKAGDAVRQRKPANGHANGHATTTATPSGKFPPGKGWEIIIVSDGSKDKTEEVAFAFARDHQLSLHPKGYAGPWTPTPHEGVHIPPGTIRVVTLAENRGKGGAVTHGMRHVRGQYVVFADADGASKFEDLGKLVTACRDIEDSDGRGVAVGSRAHMVGSEAVVKRSKLRNFLMHSFHLILWLMTPPKTATIRDTQCGFKLFSRASLPYIIPYMHSEGWIFDVEMLMLAEFSNIPVAEVPVGWREVKGSKLNVVRDSIGMAWGLAVLRAAWTLGVYKRT